MVPPMQSEGVFVFSGGEGVGPGIVDFGPLPGPTRPRGSLGKVTAGPPVICTDFQLGRQMLKPFCEVC